jgi:hypothetical protein
MSRARAVRTAFLINADVSHRDLLVEGLRDP